MQTFVDPNAATIELGSLEHIIYLIGFALVIAFLIKNRWRVKKEPKKAMVIILSSAVLQRVLSVIYFVGFTDYSLTESLPLHICRLVCYLIIIQFFVNKAWLDQIIFYWGIFAYASFIYPVGISSPFHMLGVTFFILHSLIIVYPYIRYAIYGFVPNIKGAIISALGFMVYMTSAHLLNKLIGSNYFYTIDRPFWQDLGEFEYYIITLSGVMFGFVIVGILIQSVIPMFRYITKGRLKEN